ncbi:HsdM family class I SAM-dependent methyltransferase [Aquimarina spinulae]|uniref:HsdM family class I SAM-dependent methyltransferase n=1 Tax=Aquimarina spinulae TaxID=1192023 RepID=UPI000D54F45D|nr:N-6 DNA methylase [Aquimarina spinulae]
MNNNILQYESKIWDTADLLIGSGIKQSDFPKYMMPYFALIMVESRLVRESNRLLKDFGKEKITDFDEEELEEFIEEFSELDLGYNDYVIRQNKTLATITENDTTFGGDFHAYINAFDKKTQLLLGINRGNDEEKFLNISGVSGILEKKKILFATIQAWSEIDLTPFSNSEITTLEEHIKRKWADISAETAGEQYTPDDIILLIAELITSKLEDNKQFITLYDPTCGGGNMLYGVEHYLKEYFNDSRPIATYGQDWNDALYAFASIESRFKNDAHIEYGNTLTDSGKFFDKDFLVTVANPPYGVDWKGYQKDVRSDRTGRFVDYPSVSDGQLLFTQHIIHKMNEKGLAVVVHNGSTLFSGDAGSGESNIRKHFFDEDLVEAIIQLPTDEFFNTGIYTYLWIFNKDKPIERKDKVIMINASNLFEKLKKSRGSKRKRLAKKHREKVVSLFTDFKTTDIAQVHDKWQFYYNKQAIILTNVDEKGRSYEEHLPVKENKDGELIRAKTMRLNPIKIEQIVEVEKLTIKEFEITSFEKEYIDENTGEVIENIYDDLKTYNNEKIKPYLNTFNYKENDLKVFTDKEVYYFDVDKQTLIEEKKGKKKELGNGKIVIKSAYKKATRTKKEQIVITVELMPDYEKDYEVIPFNPNPKINQETIDAYITKYIHKPYRYSDNVIGAELNFNKLFYKPKTVRSVKEVLKDLSILEDELKKIEKEFGI